ncbi:Ribonuclease H domain [Sesbania bispinosa]|nr:Ribonuclease H domain [Sesbania bispinosa]
MCFTGQRMRIVTESTAGMGGIIRSHDGRWVMGFCGLSMSREILKVELQAILEGLRICWELNLQDVRCMTDSSLAMHYVVRGVPQFHRYAVLVKEIQNILAREWNVNIGHILREGNQCANYLAKMGVESSSSLCRIPEPPNGIIPLLQANAVGTVFPHL